MVLHDVTFKCDRYNLNVRFLIFFKRFYKVHSIEVLNQDPRQQKEFKLTHNYNCGVKI
jgi:hypothetical protein